MPNTRIPGLFITKVAGVTFKNSNRTSRQRILNECIVGEKLVLVHTPLEEDENAVAVKRQNGDQIGNLGATVAWSIAPKLDKGQIVEAEIVDLVSFTSREGKDLVSCYVQITEERAKKEIARLIELGQYDEKEPLYVSKRAPSTKTGCLTLTVFCFAIFLFFIIFLK